MATAPDLTVSLGVGSRPRVRCSKNAVAAIQEVVPPPTLLMILFTNLMLAFLKLASRSSETVAPQADCRGSAASRKAFTVCSRWRALLMTRFTASLVGREKSWSTTSCIATSASHQLPTFSGPTCVSQLTFRQLSMFSDNCILVPLTKKRASAW